MSNYNSKRDKTPDKAKGVIYKKKRGTKKPH